MTKSSPILYTVAGSDPTDWRLTYVRPVKWAAKAEARYSRLDAADGPNFSECGVFSLLPTRALVAQFLAQSCAHRSERVRTEAN